MTKLKDQTFKAQWLFETLGWITLSVCKDYNTNKGFLIRGYADSGEPTGHFLWGEYETEEQAKIELATLTPKQVFEKSQERLQT